MKQELTETTERLVWTAPAERSGDGAFACGQATLILSQLSCVPKRCRVGLATAVQNRARVSAPALFPRLDLMPFGNSRSIKKAKRCLRHRLFFNPKGIVSSSPRLRGTSYLGLQFEGVSTPTGLRHVAPIVATPLGLLADNAASQGSSCLATLGFGSESLWDSVSEFPKGIIPNPYRRA